MTRFRFLLITASLLAGLGGVLVPAPSTAQQSCRSMCWGGYGACYRSTKDRQRCQAQLQRCLSSCIRSNNKR